MARSPKQGWASAAPPPIAGLKPTRVALSTLGLPLRNRGSVNLTLDLIDSIANENGKYRTRVPDYKRVNGKWVKTGGQHLDWVKQPRGMALERQMQGIGALIHEFAHTRQKPNQYNVVRDEGGADAFAALLYQKILKDLGFNEPRSAYQGYEQNYGLHYMARHGKNAACTRSSGANYIPALRGSGV